MALNTSQRKKNQFETIETIIIRKTWWWLYKCEKDLLWILSARDAYTIAVGGCGDDVFKFTHEKS